MTSGDRSGLVYDQKLGFTGPCLSAPAAPFKAKHRGRTHPEIGMSKTVLITQSNYRPWRGYFDLLRSADEVVLLESVQYTRRDWRNRNRIKTPRGTEWLTIGVEAKGRYLQTIDDTRIADPDWAESHIRAIEGAYARSAHHDAMAPCCSTFCGASRPSRS
jgi:hypothetical protein